MSTPSLKQQALDYHHLNSRPGKIAIQLTKPTDSPKDLSLAYSPGVAEPVIAIAQDKNNAMKYTNKGNLVAVISNGTAILGMFRDYN
jgi:malate dehydrogenase (oxaloacetate-decarboxylating)(NADP+)